ncbi:MAG: M48 family metallopeptidase [Parafannyhessea sp.]|uniref:M48 family metallopeptidase n=1 Tax=Parafannyhessea sp. TaxID=2847324 RepID=UPI003F040EB9
MGTAKCIDIGGVAVTVVRKRVRRVNLRVRQDGSVFVSAPARVPLSQIEEFVLAHRQWIERARQRALAREDARREGLRDGGHTHLLGRTLSIRAVADLPRRRRPRAEAEGDVLLVHVSRDVATEGAQDLAPLIGAAVEDLRRQELEELLPAMFERHEPLMGVHASGWRLRRMTSRWGSCNVRTGRITLNTELAAHPVPSIESVVVHELCHLLEPSHNARFHALMDRYCPAWREARRELDAPPRT